jgi:hypothetical protein
MNKLFNFFNEFYDRFNKNTKIAIILISLFLTTISFFIVNLDTNIINLISVVLSIIIGLMFNFASSLSDKINSEHLTIKFKFKELRLDKLELSYRSSYFSIYISIICLLICLILMTLDIKNTLIIKFVTSILVFMIIQMFLSFYFVLNDMKSFVDYDIKQERKNIKKKRLNDTNKND